MLTKTESSGSGAISFLQELRSPGEIAIMFKCNRLDPTSSSNVTRAKRCGERSFHAFPRHYTPVYNFPTSE